MNRMTPLQFVDTLDSNKHILLVYEDPKYGQIIQFRFLNNGLLKGESCVFLTEGEPKVIAHEMKKNGISVDSYLQKNLLYIYQIPNLTEDPDGILMGCEKILQRIKAELKPPYRVVGRVIPDISTEAGLEVEYALERIFHANFDGFNGSFLCHYDCTKIPLERRAQWIDKLARNHHAVIYADGTEHSRAYYVS